MLGGPLAVDKRATKKLTDLGAHFFEIREPKT